MTRIFVLSVLTSVAMICACQKKDSAAEEQLTQPKTELGGPLVGMFGKSEVFRPPPEKSIAVLPFENLSRDPDNAYFADGVQDEILTDLARVADLTVISRTSTMQYRTEVARNLRKIGLPGGWSLVAP